ncbi:unnamed protein product (macronuclear) [Paramecium tetraurelia]|uniref:Uncharacterized protein n=1 Tax=Paramecium tetraurelia TaxID=5888 RepID=A0DYU8_PARTE|nr:uncharacterized protein GSPATT00003183001 [Paramecium tetraurelia]CAK88215.1 unnamed protein product [Paramecium tetraurelia]|eukprot:XP_001455612.1 hypothetical protein (macronuclear) [Paramecium tetraurelia strain d4-2]
MIFWIDSTSIYDCRTYSLIKPQQYDVAIILDYIKQDQQQNRIDLKEKLPKLLRTLALLLVIHNKKDIFRLLQILASKDFKYTKLYNDFMNNPAAQWYIEQMKVEQVQMIMNQYILGEHKFLEGFFQKLTNSYEQFIQKQQNEQGTPEFNQQIEVPQNQDLTSANKMKDKSQQKQQQENQINQNQGSKSQILDQNYQRKKSAEEINLEKDSQSSTLKQKNEIKSAQDTKSLNQMTNKEPAQKTTQDLGQQQQLNKERISKSTIEIEDKPQQQQQQQNEQQNNKQKIVQQQQSGTKIQKEQNNQDNQKGPYFSEQQKISLESLCKDDKPDQKMLEMAKILSEKAQKKSAYSPLQSPSKFKPNPKPLEKITEKVEKRVNIEQKIAKKFNQEPEKIFSYIDTLTEKEQQDFDFSEDTELIKLFDLLKEKCEQTYWWSKFQDKCHQAMMDKELEMIMFEKLPILMKRWAIKTGKNVTEMERNPNRRHRTPIQETKNTLLDYSDPEEMTKEIIHIPQTSETQEKKKQSFDNQKIDEKANSESNEFINNNGINKLSQQNEQVIKYQINNEQEESIKQNQKNQIKTTSELQQFQNQKYAQDNLNKEINNFTPRFDDDDAFNNQNQSILVEQELLLQNEIQEVTPYQIIDIDDEILCKSFPVDNQKNQQSKVIKTVANRLNQEIPNFRQHQFEIPNKQYSQQENSFQNNTEKQKNVIFIDSANDEIIQCKKSQLPVPQQQTIQITEDCIEILNQPITKSNIFYPPIQQDFSQNNDDIDRLFQNDNDISSPDSMVSSSSILISEQSSIQFEEVQINKNQYEIKEQINPQKNKDIIKVPEKVQEKQDVRENREEEQKSREKKTSESDIEIKDKSKHKSNKRQSSKDKNENQKAKSKRKDSKNDEKDKSTAKSSSQNKEKVKEKEKNKESKIRKSSEKKNNQDILKMMQAEKDAKEKQKEELKKKEKDKLHQENIKKAEQRLEKLRTEEIEFQKEQNFLQQQSKLNEIEPGEIKQYQQRNQQQPFQQPQQLPQQQQNCKNFIQIHDQNQGQKSQERQIFDPQNVNTNQKYYQYNQQMIQKAQESQQNANRPQQLNQSQEKSVPYIPDQKGQQNNWEYQKSQQANQQNLNQYDRQQKNQINPTEQVPIQQNQYQRPNSYAFPLEQYGIQEFLTKKDQAIQKSAQKSIVNPVQYDLAQAQPPIANQGNYQMQPQQYPQNYQQAQFQTQQQQQPFQQQQFYNQQKPRDKKFRNNQPHQQDFYRQKQQYPNQQEPHVQKQRKYNPNNEYHENNQSFNYIPGQQPNMNIQPYPYHNQANDHQYANQSPFPFPNGQNYSSNQPSKQQMFEFFCQMFYDKFQQPE